MTGVHNCGERRRYRRVPANRYAFIKLAMHSQEFWKFVGTSLVSGLIVVLPGCSQRVVPMPENNMPVRGTGIAPPVSSIPDYDPNISTWKQTPSPEEMSSVNHSLWWSEVQNSPFVWRVDGNGANVTATLIESSPKADNCPPFSLEAMQFSDPQAKFMEGTCTSYRVSDGWLVGLDKGEWGGVLYWFDSEGGKNLKLADAHVEAIVEVNGEILVVEGLAHLSWDQGTILKAKNENGWKLHRVTLLPEAPSKVIVLSPNSLLIALSRSIVIYRASKSPRGNVYESLIPLLKDARYVDNVTSVAFDPVDFKVFFGTPQYVIQLDRYVAPGEGKLHFLIPNENFRYRLEAAEEERIRCYHSEDQSECLEALDKQ